MAQIAAAGDADFTDIPVPESARMPKLALMMSFWAICSAMFWLVVSATLATNFGAVNAVIALVLSVITFSLINGVISRFAIERGLSVALFSKTLFGSAGADLAALLLFATATWYAVFEGSVIAQAFHTFFGLPINTAYFLVVVYSVALVFGSIQNWLDKLNAALLPFYVAGLVGAVTLTVFHYGFSSAWLSLQPAGGATAYGWLNCYVVYLGVWAMMMFTFDYARFGRRKDLAFHTNITFGWGFYLLSILGNGLVGIFLVGTIPASGPLSEVAVVGILLKLMGVGGLLFIWVSQTRINTANFYVAALNLASLLHRAGWRGASRRLCVVLVGVIVLAIMRIDIFSILLAALSYQGVLIEGWVGIALTYMLLGRTCNLSALVAERRLIALDIPAILAWFGATTIGIALLNAGPSLSLFSAPVTAISAASFYTAGLLLPSASRARTQLQN